METQDKEYLELVKMAEELNKEKLKVYVEYMPDFGYFIELTREYLQEILEE